MQFINLKSLSLSLTHTHTQTCPDHNYCGVLRPKADLLFETRLTLSCGKKSPREVDLRMKEGFYSLLVTDPKDFATSLEVLVSASQWCLHVLDFEIFL